MRNALRKVSVEVLKSVVSWSLVEGKLGMTMLGVLRVVDEYIYWEGELV